MMEKPPIQGVKGVNLTKGKTMLERKVRIRERPAPPAGEDLPETGGDAVPPTPPEGSSL